MSNKETTGLLDINLSGGGELSRLIRNKDWSSSSLGEPENWPQSLLTTLSIILHSKFPMFLFWGPDLVCFYNDAYREILGNEGKHPAMLGEKAADHWQEIWTVIKPLIDQVLAGGPATWAKDQLIPIHRNGKLEQVYWTFSYSAVNDESGNPAGVFVTCMDTTDNITFTKKLEDSEERFRMLADNMAQLAWMADAEGSIYWYNKRWYEYTATHFEDMKGWGWKAVHHPDHLERVVTKLQHAFDSGENWEDTFPLKNKDGKYRWFLSRASAIKNDAGEILRWFGTSTDITHQKKEEEHIRESEERFRNVANSVPVLIWMSDTEMLTYFFNKAWLNFTGKTMDEELGIGWAEGIHPDDYKKFLENYAFAFDRKEAFYIEYRLKRKDGIYRWLSVNAVPRFSINNVFEGFTGACMDIHEQVIYQKKLKEDEERLNIIIAASELGTWDLNMNSEKLNFSTRFLEIFGFIETTDLPHLSFLSMVHPDDLATRNTAFELSLSTGQLIYESRIIWNDQSIHWIEVKGKVYFNEKNEAEMIFGTVRDITDEKYFQTALLEREKKFRLLADSMPEFVWTGDAAGTLNYFNKSVYDYSGISAEDIARDGWLQIVHPEDREANIALWNESIETGNDFVFEHRFRRHDGLYRWQLSRAIPQLNSEGIIQMWVGTSADIHDRKIFSNELEKQVQERTTELEQKNNELEKMNTELQSFAYISSHDLQEPLRKIQTFAAWLLEKEENNLSATGKDYFERMRSASKRMQTLIEDLLIYSRTNTSERNFEICNLNIILEEVKAELKEEIEHKNAEIISTDLRELKTIPFQFRQLLQNLLSNSLKFSNPDVPVRITINSEFIEGADIHLPKIVKDRKYLHITVSDNGIGFEQQYEHRIFEVFQRLHGKSEYKGTGIGLAIVKKIVENHHGFISATGILNEGATFNIYIPEL